jgi:hypothetical protein
MNSNEDSKLQGALSLDKPAVTRSLVPEGKPYREYLPALRDDFIYSCAYCTISEAEAQAIRFSVDHYEPRAARPDLENDYYNLMYCCDECNSRKGDRCPPAEARSNGHRFFRPDQDVHQEHFLNEGIRVNPRSNIGFYSIEALDLNRLALRRIREIRQRAMDCDRMVAEGVRGLRSFHIDQLPANLKGPAVRAIGKAEEVASRMAEQVDSILKENARSPLLDTDGEQATRARERADRLAALQVLYPGAWRAPRTPRRPARRPKSE